MQYFPYGAGPCHRAPFPDGPTVEIITGAGAPEQRLASARVQLPPGAAMPEHDHGESEALVVPVDGDIVLSTNGDTVKLEPGSVVRLPRGERVRVENVGDRPAEMIAVFTPASFLDKLAAWPAA